MAERSSPGPVLLADFQPHAGRLRTRLAPQPKRVQELEERFQKLWEQADPERQIDE